MKRLILSLITSLALTATAQDAGGFDSGVPPGWFFAGPQGAFELGVGAGACDERSAWLRSTASDAGPMARGGTVMQLFKADRFRGQRVRFSGVTSTKDVIGTAALWMRVDVANKRTVAFDNMKDRPLTGTTPCAKRAVVLDVPQDAEFIALGVMLEGRGRVELAQVDIEGVDDSVTVTDQLIAKKSVRVGDAPLGRVGSVWFTEDTMSSYGGVSGMNREGAHWAGGEFDAEFKDGRVVGRMGPHSGSLQVRREGETTVIEGTWGTSLASYPVVIRYNRSTLDMKWGFYERHLKQEHAPQLPDSCVYYSQRSGTWQADELELCGSVLDDRPVPVQTVMAFMWNGFHRVNTFDLGPLPTKPDPPPAPKPRK